MKPLEQRLRECRDRLSAQEQRVAAFIVDHSDDLMSYNSADLARLSGVSKATVSRLFRHLGYASFREMREESRRLRQSGIPVADNRDAVQGNTLLARHYRQEMANLSRWVNALQAQGFSEAIDALASRRRIGIVGLRNSYPVALHLRQQLLQVRGNVALLPQPGQTLAEELVDFTEQDCVVVIAFRRRPRGLSSLLTALRQQAVPVLLISEPQSAALNGQGNWHFTTPLDSVSAFDSYASAMSLVNLLANALLHERLESGRERIHCITGLYSDLDELESH